MKKGILILLIITMINAHKAQSQAADFFNHKNKEKYKVTLYTDFPPNNALPKYQLNAEDTREMMSIFAAHDYVWVKGIPVTEPNLNGYYKRNYCMEVIHPSGKYTYITVNAGGIGGNDFYIQPQKRFFKLVNSLSQDDVEHIKTLFMKNIRDFRNISTVPGAQIGIIPVIYPRETHNGALPPIYLGDTDTQKFLELYNTGWDCSYSSLTGEPVATVDRTRYMVTYNGQDLFGYWSKTLEFTDENRKSLFEIIDNALKTYNGEYKVLLNGDRTAYYTYKDGLLHGPARIYNVAGSLIEEVIYLSGNLIYSVTYNANGSIRDEFHYVDNGYFEYRIYWKHYGEDGTLTEGISDGFADMYHLNRDFDYRRQFQHGRTKTIEVKKPVSKQILKIEENE